MSVSPAQNLRIIHNQSEYLLSERDVSPSTCEKPVLTHPGSNKHHSWRPSDSTLHNRKNCGDDTSLDNSDYVRIDEKYGRYFLLTKQLTDDLRKIGWHSEAEKVCRCHTVFKVYSPQCSLGTSKPSRNVAVPTDSCFNRLCPFCGKIRRDRALRKLEQVFPQVKRPKLLTLTVENVPNLTKKYLGWLRKCFSDLRRRKLFSSVVSGGVYAMEITRNKEKGTWHAHIHALIDSGYIDQAELSETWNDITKGKGRIVDIRQADAGSLDEVVKYLTKGTDFIGTPELVKEFLEATQRCRMLSTFGDFYGFEFDENAVEFPACPECGCTDKEHYFVTRQYVPSSEIFSVRRGDEHYLTCNTS